MERAVKARFPTRDRNQDPLQENTAREDPAQKGTVAQTETETAAPKTERGPYARGVRKKRDLLRAVLRLLAREGARSVTHRAVAAEAGASLRSTTYYFATKEDMLRQAFRHFVERSLERIDRISLAAVTSEVDLDVALDLVIEQLIQESQDPDTSWAAEFELVLAISREPSLAPEYQEFQEKLEALLNRTMHAAGSPCPAHDARIVLGYLRGFELEQLSRPDRELTPEALRVDLRRLISALTANRD